VFSILNVRFCLRLAKPYLPAKLREDVRLGVSKFFTCCDENAILTAIMLDILEAIVQIRYAGQEEENAKLNGLGLQSSINQYKISRHLSIGE